MNNQIVLMYHDLYFRDKSESGFQNSTALKYKVSAKAFEAQVQSIENYLKCNKRQTNSVDFTFDVLLTYYTFVDEKPFGILDK